MKVKALHPKKEFANVRAMVEEIGDLYAGSPAYRYRVNPHDKEPVIVTYDAMRDDIRGLASELIARGLMGKKIAVIGKHTYQWILCYYSIMAIGSVLVPLDRDWGADELTETVKSGECDFLITDADIEAKATEIATALSLSPLLFI